MAKNTDDDSYEDEDDRVAAKKNSLEIVKLLEAAQSGGLQWSHSFIYQNEPLQITTEVKDDCSQMLNHMFTKQKALIGNSSDNMLTNQTKMCRLREEEARRIDSVINST